MSRSRYENTDAEIERLMTEATTEARDHAGYISPRLLVTLAWAVITAIVSLRRE